MSWHIESSHMANNLTDRTEYGNIRNREIGICRILYIYAINSFLRRMFESSHSCQFGYDLVAASRIQRKLTVLRHLLCDLLWCLIFILSHLFSHITGHGNFNLASDSIHPRAFVYHSAHFAMVTRESTDVNKRTNRNVYGSKIVMLWTMPEICIFCFPFTRYCIIEAHFLGCLNNPGYVKNKSFVHKSAIWKQC